METQSLIADIQACTARLRELGEVPSVIRINPALLRWSRSGNSHDRRKQIRRAQRRYAKLRALGMQIQVG